MKKILLITLVLTAVFAEKTIAQRDFQLTQGHFSRITLNPAATGQSNYLNASLFSRKQWVGFDGAPVLQTLNVHKYLKGPKLGVGLLFSNDKLGNETAQDLKLLVAYHAWFSEKAILSMGLGFGINSRSVDGTKLTFDDPSDIAILNNNKRQTTPDFNFGLEFTMPNLVLGASATHLTVSKSNSTIYKLPAHLYNYGRYTIKTGEKLNLIPLYSLAYNSKVIQTEVGVIASGMNDQFWGGLIARPNDAMAILAGVTVLKNLKLGYSYDMSIGSMKSYNSGSHEIMIAYKFGKDTPMHIPSPRFFD